MFLIDRLIRSGLGFVLDQVARVAEAEMDSEERLREDLLAARMRLELGELDEGEFAAVERELLAQLREAQVQGRRPAALASEEISGVEISVPGDED